MNKCIVLLLSIFVSTGAIAASIIHPLDFKGGDAEKKKVIQQIKLSVKKTYSQIGMGDPSTLRMMEKEELNSFKKLTKVDNRKLLDNVIRQYCSVGMCNYNTIFMMYNEQNKASKQNLTW
ncbi:MAG: hypothetical protein HRT55_06465 [Colwellia sp.]|uniref:hypothetical protein n=1 Tax=Colwellia sp. TaxID=56799 RepID=UPI001E028B58|nr:hypothetical protein [Colwellia sp.]NQY58181.1 hypothetical protein [Ilumatobacteraceae bacterium]NQZ25942.1 hypothetical protein [Colwellia sp.]